MSPSSPRTSSAKDIPTGPTTLTSNEIACVQERIEHLENRTITRLALDRMPLERFEPFTQAVIAELHALKRAVQWMEDETLIRAFRKRIRKVLSRMRDVVIDRKLNGIRGLEERELGGDWKQLAIEYWEVVRIYDLERAIPAPLSKSSPPPPPRSTMRPALAVEQLGWPKRLKPKIADGKK